MENLTSTEESPRVIQQLLTVLNNINWTTFLAGAAIGMVGLHLLSGRPLQQRLNSMESELGLVRSSLDAVAGARTDVEQANDLLTALAEQRSRLNSASASLAVIDRLSADVSVSSEQAEEAETALARLVTLNRNLVETGRRQDEAAAALAGVRGLQSRVVEIGADAEQALAQLKDARQALCDLNDLQQRVVETTGETDRARAALNAVTALQCDLAATDVSTTRARAAAERLIALNDGIAESAGRLSAAEQNAERLIALQDRLVSDERLEFLEAASNVERLIRIQAEIASQTDDLVDSITALELLDDFQDEFNAQAAGVQEMRRQLTELILLQTTIEQALEIVEPISELGDLRRLDTHEVREAARIILDQRRARLARGEHASDVASVEATDEDATANESDAAEIHSPEIHRPVPVPPEEQ